MRYASITDRLAHLGSGKWTVHIKAREMADKGIPIIELTIGEPDIMPDASLLDEADRSMRAGFLKQFRMVSSEGMSATNVQDVVNACHRMASNRTGALMVFRRNNSLDFVKNSGDQMNIELNQPIIESIFYKNSPLHDGAMIIEENIITATRVILPVSNEKHIPQRFGLRHRAAIGITEKTDAVCLVVSEENGQISYIKEGDFVFYEDADELIHKLETDLSV